jgi:hypothetical protein
MTFLTWSHYRSSILALAMLSGGDGAKGEEQPNTLTAEEQSAGWKLLFDGHSLTGWQPLGKDGEAVKGWVAENGTLKLPPKTQGGDITTTDHFDDFELSFDWKISPAGNSGLKYNLVDPKRALGCEYQLLDDSGHPDAKVGPRRQTAALYDVLPPAADKTLKSPGEWNTSRLVVRGNAVEHWLNGAKVLAYEFGSAELEEKVAKSKFKGEAAFALKRRSPILLQDHDDEVAFRSMKIRRLTAE